MLAGLVSFIIAMVAGRLVIQLYQRFGWLDDPGTNHHAKVIHARAVPRGGGLVIYAAIACAALIFLKWDTYLFAIMAGGLLLTIIGWLDDVYDLHPATRLIAGSIAALLVIGSGIGIAYISNPLGGGVIHLDQPQLLFSFLGEQRQIWLLSDIFAFIFIVWNMNIVNWSKGVDGQLPAYVTVAFIFIALLSQRFIDDPTNFGTMQLSLIAAGAFAGLLFWNWFPQRMMPGYGAGSLAGYLLAILAILSGAKVATVIMVLAIPTTDAIFTIARRLYRHKSPLWGDRGHLHHKLLDVYGWNKQSIALFYAGCSLLLGSLSLYLNTPLKLLTIALAGSLVVVLQVEAKRRTNKGNHERT